MSMSEFNNQNDHERADVETLHALNSALPDDFSEDDLEFAHELNTLFPPQDEELPPYFVQTLLAAEDPRYQPAHHWFAEQTSARVFRSLRLRRRLFPVRRSTLLAISDTLHDIFSRKVVLAWFAAFILLMMGTVAFTAPSFERGVVYLLQGTRSGALEVHRYPGNIKSLTVDADADISSGPSTVNLSAAQQSLHFKMSWPSYLPAGYQLDGINLIDDPTFNNWADGPILELVYDYNGPGVSQGTGQIVIREFVPQEEVLQVVQDGAAHPIGVDQNGNAQAIYVEGQWLPRGKFITPLWSSVGRRELIFQQNGVVFWIAGDQRDGIDEKALWSIAQSLQPVNFNVAPIRKEVVTLLGADDSPTGPFAHDLLAVYPNDSVDGPYYINVSSYVAVITSSTLKPASHHHG
jgi:hypothetical protein